MPVFVPAFFSLKGRATVEEGLPCVWLFRVKFWRRRRAVGTASPKCSSGASPARSIWTSCRRQGSAITCWCTSGSPSAKSMRPRPCGLTSYWSRWGRWRKSRRALHRQNEFSDVRAALHVAVGAGGLRQRENAIHQHLHSARFQQGPHAPAEFARDLALLGDGTRAHGGAGHGELLLQ